MKLQTKVKGWFNNSDDKKTEKNQVAYQEQNEENDGSPVPDMLKLDDQEEVEDDNFDAKERDSADFGNTIEAVAK